MLPIHPNNRFHTALRPQEPLSGSASQQNQTPPVNSVHKQSSNELEALSLYIEELLQESHIELLWEIAVMLDFDTLHINQVQISNEAHLKQIIFSVISILRFSILFSEPSFVSEYFSNRPEWFELVLQFSLANRDSLFQIMVFEVINLFFIHAEDWIEIYADSENKFMTLVLGSDRLENLFIDYRDDVHRMRGQELRMQIDEMVDRYFVTISE